jgi:hypothetical protein
MPMQRTRRAGFLTTLTAVLAHGLLAQGTEGEVRVTEVVPVRGGAPARLCPGAGNAVRVGIAWSGTIPERPIQVRLSLATRGETGRGVLVGEGSVTPHAGASATTFTFLNVQVPERLRGRGAQLVARVVADRAVVERDTTNNARSLQVDAADWACRH